VDSSGPVAPGVRGPEFLSLQENSGTPDGGASREGAPHVQSGVRSSVRSSDGAKDEQPREIATARHRPVRSSDPGDSGCCPRCGAALVPLYHLVNLAVAGRDAYERMRLVVPDAIPRALRELAARLPCWAGTCPPQQLELEGQHKSAREDDRP
jgi:hypothetical protein